MYFPLIIIALVLYFAYKRHILYKQAELFNKLLYIDKNPERYVDEIDKLLLKMQSERERNINLIQKTTGLFYSGMFDEAISILEEKVEKIPSNWQAVYYHNLILSLFFSGKTERANDVLNGAKDAIDIYLNRNVNKTPVEFIYAAAEFFNKKGKGREEYFSNLTKNATNDYRIALSNYFLSKIYEEEQRIDESEEYMDKARIFGQGSFIEHL
jgi:tetratricopeptide (TPR) repeat protein